jgi:hypothetical protein
MVDHQEEVVGGTREGEILIAKTTMIETTTGEGVTRISLQHPDLVFLSTQVTRVAGLSGIRLP